MGRPGPPLAGSESAKISCFPREHDSDAARRGRRGRSGSAEPRAKHGYSPLLWLVSSVPPSPLTGWHAACSRANQSRSAEGCSVVAVLIAFSAFRACVPPSASRWEALPRASCFELVELACLTWGELGLGPSLAARRRSPAVVLLLRLLGLLRGLPRLLTKILGFAHARDDRPRSSRVRASWGGGAHPERDVCLTSRGGKPKRGDLAARRSLFRLAVGQAPIAQLDRASAYEAGGRKFESSWARRARPCTKSPAPVPGGFGGTLRNEDLRAPSPASGQA
jgi:hypothetical protein